ncbi:MAG: DUF2218 domain-containing protein [Actinomycetota bacterium]
MLTTEATVETERASRYLAQLCRHFGNLRRHESRFEEQAPPDLHVNVEWSDTHGTITFDCGRCTLQAESDALTLNAEAADEEGLQRVKDLVGGHVERFGSRDHLSVNWQ